jgi:NAD(P)-dependent dehydrogenase (short-subunit alcohol dehydrogenase family)
VAIVTGAGRGLGRAHALELARQGAAVVVNDIGVELDGTGGGSGPAGEVVAEIRKQGGKAIANGADVADWAQAADLVKSAVAAFGRLDALVNNAGYGLRSWLEETPDAEAERIVAVNLLGSFTPTAAAVPGMRARGRGHVIFVSSVVGKKGTPGYALYSATKFGQIGLADALRAEVAADGIEVSVVYPISTATGFREARVLTGATPVPPHATVKVQSAEHVARAILACLRRPRAEVHPFPLTRLFAALVQIFPGLTTRLIASPRRDRPAPR